jgi:hypothetical protein
MRRFLLALACGLCAGPALALSCLPASVDNLYAQAAQASASYVPVVGRLDQIYIDFAPPREGGLPAGGQGRAVFTGNYVSAAGALVPWSTPVVVEVTCAASWCGSAPASEPFLGFLRVEGTTYHFTSDACPTVIYQPTAAEQARLQACMRGADCAIGF